MNSGFLDSIQPIPFLWKLIDTHVACSPSTPNNRNSFIVLCLVSYEFIKPSVLFKRMFQTRSF